MAQITVSALEPTAEVYRARLGPHEDTFLAFLDSFGIAPRYQGEVLISFLIPGLKR